MFQWWWKGSRKNCEQWAQREVDSRRRGYFAEWKLKLKSIKGEKSRKGKEKFEWMLPFFSPTQKRDLRRCNFTFTWRWYKNRRKRERAKRVKPWKWWCGRLGGCLKFIEKSIIIPHNTFSCSHSLFLSGLFLFLVRSLFPIRCRRCRVFRLLSIHLTLTAISG